MIRDLALRFVGNLAALWVASGIFSEMTYGDSMHQLGEVAARMQDTAGVFA